MVGYEDTPPHSTLAYTTEDLQNMNITKLPRKEIADSPYSREWEKEIEKEKEKIKEKEGEKKMGESVGDENNENKERNNNKDIIQEKETVGDNSSTTDNSSSNNSNTENANTNNTNNIHNTNTTNNNTTNNTNPDTNTVSNTSSTLSPPLLPIRTTIFLADTSRTNSSLLSAKWENIATDIECVPPQHFNIRKPWLGVYERPTKKKGCGNIHCIMKFSKG